MFNPNQLKNDMGPGLSKAARLQLTLGALFTHALLGVICVVELLSVPLLIRIFEDHDTLLPKITIWIITIYATFRGVWFILPLPALGLLAADACIFCFLFHQLRYRFLGILWFFAVLFWLLLFTIFITAALFLPFRDPA